MPDMPVAAPLIEARALTKIYIDNGFPLTVFAGLTLKVFEGDIVVLTGASGSGKSTLLNIFGCLDKQSAGELWINGIETNTFTQLEITKVRREHIGFVFQRSHLLPHLTALENVLLPFRLAGELPNFTKGLDLLSEVGLADRAYHKPAQLSGGEQQRVAVARALVRSPGIVLADEPTGSLNKETGQEILSLIMSKSSTLRPRTLVLVTHQPELVNNATRYLHLDSGQLHES